VKVRDTRPMLAEKCPELTIRLRAPQGIPRGPEPGCRPDRVVIRGVLHHVVPAGNKQSRFGAEYFVLAACLLIEVVH
jgi:hypothetical protein